MTGFGVLYYTDCVPGQGLNGSAGFQFQAASGGLTTEAMPLVQGGLLYEAPVAWMRERRPAHEYPRSLTHACGDGIYATAAGCYLGQEANGSRQGNQFTHAVVTRDLGAYSFLRPAQLWDAPWWSAVAADGTELPELASGPECGPLDTETVRERVRAAAEGEQLLTALLSAVERLADPDSRQKIVLVTADPERAACWIAAATLLLPQRQALAVGFKIFVADAQYSRHDVIALHPEWAGRWADTGQGQGLVVFDLDRRRHTRTDATEAAAFWVPRFLAAQDPLDIVDAVELAGAIARDDAASGTERLAAAVVSAGEPLSGSDQLKRVSTWLAEAPEGAAERVREPLVDAVLAAGPDTDVLRDLAATISTRNWGTARATVRAGLLAAEIEEAQTSPDGVAAARRFTRLPALPSYPADDAGVHRIELALRGVDRPELVPALLTVAARHGVRPAPNLFRKEADWFARWWVANTGKPQVHGLFECLRAPEPLDWVRDVLRELLVRGETTSAADAIRSYWWRHLWRDSRDPTDPLHAQVLQAAYRELDGPAARELLGRVQDDARAHGATDPGATAWDVVFGDLRPGISQARHFLEALRKRELPVSSVVSGRLADVSDADLELSDDSSWLGDELTRMGIRLSPRVDRIHEARRSLDHALAELVRDSPGWPPPRIAGALNDAPPDLLRKRLRDVMAALLGARGQTAVEVLAKCAPDVLRAVFSVMLNRPFWPLTLSGVTSRQRRVLVLSFRIVYSVQSFPEDRQVMLGQLADHLAIVLTNAEKRVLKEIQHDFPADLRGPLSDWSDELRGGGKVKKWLGSLKRTMPAGDPGNALDGRRAGPDGPGAGRAGDEGRSSG